MTTTTLLDFQAEPRIERHDRHVTFAWPVGWRRWTSPRVDDPTDVFQVWATLTVAHDGDRRRYTSRLSYQQEQKREHSTRIAFGIMERIAGTIVLENIPCSRYSAKSFDLLVDRALASLRGCQDLDEIIEFRTALAAACNTEAPA